VLVQAFKTAHDEEELLITGRDRDFDLGLVAVEQDDGGPGREKAPAALCRKVIEAKDKGRNWIEIWGDGTRTRSFMFIDDCVKGIDRITRCEDLIATPINLGSSELVSVDDLVTIIEGIAGVKLERRYDLSAPKGVGGRNSDNTMIKHILGWEPSTPLRDGLRKTYAWIEEQYADRKAGKKTIE